MATTIKYKNLFVTALKYLSIVQLYNIREDLINQTNELRKKESELSGMELTRCKNEIENLVAQVGLISGYIHNYINEHLNKCELCGKHYTNFSRNICEDCFDAEVDKMYSDDEQD